MSTFSDLFVAINEVASRRWDRGCPLLIPDVGEEISRYASRYRLLTFKLENNGIL